MTKLIVGFSQFEEGAQKVQVLYQNPLTYVYVELIRIWFPIT